MSKFSNQLEEVQKNAPTSGSPIQTTAGRDAPTTVTHEGGAGWEREPKGELFLLAVTNMVSENTFYESGKARDERFVSLIHTVSKSDPLWMGQFITWLRNSANMRSASLVAAVEFGRATVTENVPGAWRSQIVDAACQRADEPGEMLAYYWATNQGGRRTVSMWLRRGLNAAAKRLYNEKSVLKYDTPTHIVRMADVINICHPNFNGENVPLYDYILHRRQGHKPFEQMEALSVISARVFLDGVPAEQRRELLSDIDLKPKFSEAGVTWEFLSSWLPGGMDVEAWESVIPVMGYMALLRNLRNFDQAGVSQEIKEQVAAKLADPDNVAKSRQFPFRFLSAYKAVNNDFWRWPLGKALDASLSNVPMLSGRTLILVDDSGSMYSTVAGSRSDLQRHEAAKLFGVALGLRAEAVDLVQYSNSGQRIDLSRGASVLNILASLPRFGGGTQTFDVLRQFYSGHDRVVILTDEQAFPVARHQWSNYSRSYGDPAAGIICPIYTFNLAGYKAAHLASGSNRVTFGGLTDAGFAAIGALETRRAVGWPWEV
jgi:hypothetical protein